jgi:hypothetical protein
VRGLPTFWRGEEVGTPRFFLTDFMRVWPTPGMKMDMRPWVHLVRQIKPLECLCAHPDYFFVAGNQERKKIRDYQWVSETCQFFDYFFAAER